MPRRSTCFGAVPCDDESADANIVTGLNSQAGREVYGLRREASGLMAGLGSESAGVTVGLGVDCGVPVAVAEVSV